MTKRIHSSLGYLTPVEFETAFAARRRSQPPPKECHNESSFMGPPHEVNPVIVSNSQCPYTVQYPRAPTVGASGILASKRLKSASPSWVV